MSVNHESHKARVNEYAAKSGHNVQYNDGGIGGYHVPMSKQQRKDWAAAVKKADSLAGKKHDEARDKRDRDFISGS
jgi:hypothetical protein